MHIPSIANCLFIFSPYLFLTLHKDAHHNIGYHMRQSMSDHSIADPVFSVQMSESESPSFVEQKAAYKDLRSMRCRRAILDKFLRAILFGILSIIILLSILTYGPVICLHYCSSFLLFIRFIQDTIVSRISFILPIPQWLPASS